MQESILNAIHATAQGLHQNGVMKLETLREFDALCIPPVKKNLKHDRDMSNGVDTHRRDRLLNSEQGIPLSRAVC